MSQNDNVFPNSGVKKPEKVKNLSESFDDDLSSDEDDDIIDLLDSSEEPEDEEILELKETVNEDEGVIELTLAAENDTEADEDILELVEEADVTAGQDEDIIELAEEADVTAGQDEDILELTEKADITTDEDKQILELIDDIQSTLDETKGIEGGDTGEETDQNPLPKNAEEEPDEEEAFDEPMIMGDDETFETEGLSYSESEFVDHLGLDLTTEFSKEMFKEDSEISIRLGQKIEEAVERVIHNMLADKNSLLVRTITKAAQKGD